MSSRNLEILDHDECMELLRARARADALGRVGLQVGATPTVLPVLYGLLGDDVVFRTDPGTKLSAAVMGANVAFEVDGADVDAHTGWSVVVVGKAEEIRDRATLDRVAALGIEPWVGEGRDHVIRIPTDRITGRRLTGAGSRASA